MFSGSLLQIVTKRGKKIFNKEELAEDWCFECKDGGELMICDYGKCLKTYHPACVEKDDSFESFNAVGLYPLGWPSGLGLGLSCWRSQVRNPLPAKARGLPSGSSSSCQACLVQESVDLRDHETYEGLFREYYQIVKTKEGIDKNKLLAGKAQLDKEKICQINSYSDKRCEKEDEQLSSDNEDFSDGEPQTKRLKKKRCTQLKTKMQSKNNSKNPSGWPSGLGLGLPCWRSQVRNPLPAKARGLPSGSSSSHQGRGFYPVRTQRVAATGFPCHQKKNNNNSKKQEFVGWGSKALTDFLLFIGQDTREKLSKYDVSSIVTKYIEDHSLIHPVKKTRILCDVQLEPVFGKKMVNRCKILSLLESHFVDNEEQLKNDELDDDLEDDDTEILVAPKTEKSLVMELIKQSESIETKIIGSFVRVKLDPRDSEQCNSHQLMQITGIKLGSSDTCNSGSSIQVSNMAGDVSLTKLSDAEISEVELEQKAEILHEDITKHYLTEHQTSPKDGNLAQIRNLWRKDTSYSNLGTYSFKLLTNPVVIPEEVEPFKSEQEDGASCSASKDFFQTALVVSRKPGEGILKLHLLLPYII
ncbi:hypothetical protein H5410_010948 [Solanum commersonii]|uniref:Uncharacterized protein n=1 Tax=Solanum commersonii TaxID=4109 RepID=A0A9J6ANL9_SOLCO|nr:hypothetical protein H5410_010948 [Solanum commersonii]